MLDTTEIGKELFLLGLAESLMEMVNMSETDKLNKAKYIKRQYPYKGSGHYVCGVILSADHILKPVKFAPLDLFDEYCGHLYK